MPIFFLLLMLYLFTNRFEYRWRDIENGDIVLVGACSYVHFLLDWAFQITSNQNTHYNIHIRRISMDLSRRLFRAYAHIFHEHYGQISGMGLSSEFDARLIHLSHFLLKHKVLTAKELIPMKLFFSGKVHHHHHNLH